MSTDQLVEAAAAVRGGVVAHLNLTDAAGAADFYKKALAAEEAARVPAQDGKRLLHCHLYINGGSLLLADFFEEHGYAPVPAQGYTLHLQVDDPDPWWDRAVQAGMTVVMPLEKQFWGDRYGQLRDPWGVSWSIGGRAD